VEFKANISKTIMEKRIIKTSSDVKLRAGDKLGFNMVKHVY
jgi:hypothetical protein